MYGIRSSRGWYVRLDEQSNTIFWSDAVPGILFPCQRSAHAVLQTLQMRMEGDCPEDARVTRVA